MTKRKVKFEIGDRVLVDADTDAPGRSGTVVRYDESDDDVVVSFRRGGWTDDGHSSAKHCGYINPECLTVAPVKAAAPSMATKKPVETISGGYQYESDQEMVFKVTTVLIATAATELDAVRIAATLNEAEGL